MIAIATIRLKLTSIAAMLTLARRAVPRSCAIAIVATQRLRPQTVENTSRRELARKHGAKQQARDRDVTLQRIPSTGRQRQCGNASDEQPQSDAPVRRRGERCLVPCLQRCRGRHDAASRAGASVATTAAPTPSRKKRRLRVLLCPAAVPRRGNSPRRDPRRTSPGRHARRARRGRCPSAAPSTPSNASRQQGGEQAARAGSGPSRATARTRGDGARPPATAWRKRGTAGEQRNECERREVRAIRAR